MNAVEFHHLAKNYGNTPVLHDINLTVEDGDFMVIYGLPTSGKSVLVRLLTGLEKPDSGQIFLRGNDVTISEPGTRNIGYVPQSFALYPHLSVCKNISYPLDLIRASKSEISNAVERVSELLGIAELLDRKPDQLSGGQKQRVAIARGLAKQTDVYVLDDPLIGLDFKLRERLIDDLKQTQKVLGVTFIYTTSDAIETLMLAKNIAVMDQGKIVEVGSPDQLYEQPMRAQTMQYVGFPQANFTDGMLVANGASPQVKTDILAFDLEYSGEAKPNFEEKTRLHNDQPVTVGIRPEHIMVGNNAPVGALTREAKILLREDLGGEEIVYLDVAGTNLTAVLTGLHVNDTALDQLDLGKNVTIWMKPTDLVVYAEGQRIGKGVENA